MTFPRDKNACGLSVPHAVSRLRRYASVERRCIKILAGWFLCAPSYETKYALGYHLWDHAEHVHWLRERLSEMRGGHAEAAMEPALRHLMDEALHAPNTASLLRGLYGVIGRDLQRAYRRHLEDCDPSANAAEVRLLKRILPEIDAQQAWYEQMGLEDGVPDTWQDYLRSLLAAAGGIDGCLPIPADMPAACSPPGTRFERSRTIILDERVRRAELSAYDARQGMDARQATVEQFKVFFNELYAAALVASVLFDAAEDGLPWEFFHDFSHHFWDEVRHSQFGAIRLKEMGQEPDVYNPVLYENSESMPYLNRLCYLTLGLEAYFMPRKKPRLREYEANGDSRSQLFADHDWSDEGMHVRYGKRWVDFLLLDDYRTPDDIQQEVSEHLARVTGRAQEKVAAPF